MGQMVSGNQGADLALDTQAQASEKVRGFRGLGEMWEQGL